MSGSSYWPMSAVYVHGTAPLSRIQATATDVSRPPEKAMPTRSPLGRVVRTLDNSVVPFGKCSELLGEGLAPGRVATDHQHGVVARDAAEHVGQLDLVDRAGEELRRTRWRAQDDQVGAGLGAREQLGTEPGQPVVRRGALAVDGSAVAALGGYGVDERAGGEPDLDRVQLDQVTAQGGLGDVHSPAAEQLGELGLRPDFPAAEQVGDELLTCALGQRGQGVLTHFVAPPARPGSPSVRAGGS